ncbi:MAG: alkylated DNA repair dioxygenase AlkB [Myxococcota bacterium]|jgi:alkylated DNA repair dioxygenase AlkB
MDPADGQPPWSLTLDFVPDPHALFSVVDAEVPWTDQMRSRRTASMGLPYNYSGASYAEAPWHPAVAALRDRVAARLGFEPTNGLLNHYPDGRASLGWHSDDVDILAPDTPIAIVSLGAARPLGLRRTTEAGFEYDAVELEPGSLLVMSQAMQATWRHRLARHPTDAPRISLTFRRIVRVVSAAERRAAQGRPAPWSR